MPDPEPDAAGTPDAIPLLDAASSPPQAKPALDGLRQALGFTPNLAFAMAHAPAALSSYVQGLNAVGSVLSPAEAQLVMLAASRANGAPYGVAVHTALARASGAASQAIQAARSGDETAGGPRLRALLRLARLITERAPTARSDTAAFTPGELVEVAYAVSLKQFANTVAGLSSAPVDLVLTPFEKAER